MFYPLKALGRLRVSESTELRGLDLAEHDEGACKRLLIVLARVPSSLGRVLASHALDRMTASSHLPLLVCSRFQRRCQYGRASRRLLAGHSEPQGSRAGVVWVRFHRLLEGNRLSMFATCFRTLLLVLVSAPVFLQLGD